MISIIKEHQVTMKKKPSVKRLKNKAKSAAESNKNSHQTESKKPQSQTNGNALFTAESGSDDVEEWREYSQSIQLEKMEPSSAPEKTRQGRLEGEALHYCAERDDRKNQAVLIMQKDQVNPRGCSGSDRFKASFSFTPILSFSFRPCVSVGNAFWLVYMVG